MTSDPSAPDVRSPRRRDIRLISVLSALSIAGWAVPALLMADRGFSIQDEGTYVLSYRWWHSNPYFTLGSQYFYGPIFEGLGEHVVALRILRLVMVVAANAWFGWTFCGWLGRHRGAPPDRELRVAGTLLLTAPGGLAYLWSPLTPGYYDLAACASLALVTLFVALMDRTDRPPLWIPLAAGAVTFVLILTKWPAVVVVLVTEAAALALLLRTPRREAVRYALGSVSGFALTALACHLFLVRLPRVVSVVGEMTSLVASGTHGTSSLLQGYLDNAVLFAVSSVLFAIPGVVGYVVAGRMTAPGSAAKARGVVLTGIGTTGLLVPFAVGWRGGADQGRVVVAVILATLVIALVAAFHPRRPDPPARSRRLPAVLLTAVLLLVPVGESVGSDVPWIYLAAEGLSLWVALVVVAATGPGRPTLSTYTVTVSLCMTAVTVAMMAGSTTLVSPFKTTGYADDTASVAALGGLRLSPTVAREYDALGTALDPHVTRGVTPMFTVGQVAGLTYLLGGRPIGPTWTNAADPEVLAGTLALACRNGDVDPSRPPVLLVDRVPDPEIVRALATCGFRFPTDFHRLDVPDGPPGITVYLPNAPRS